VIEQGGIEIGGRGGLRSGWEIGSGAKLQCERGAMSKRGEGWMIWWGVGLGFGNLGPRGMYRPYSVTERQSFLTILPSIRSLSRDITEYETASPAIFSSFVFFFSLVLVLTSG
jgi:hypothetical protein